MLRWTLKTILILLFALPTNGQSELRFRNFTINDGLSQSSALCMVQDGINTLWIGTQDGLNRWDGHSFQTYNASDTKGLNSNYIRSSIQGKDGLLWFGTNNGLTQFNIKTETFQTFSDDRFPNLDILDIAEAENGNIWFTTVNQGLFSFQPKEQRIISHSAKVPSKRTVQIAIAKNRIITSLESGKIYVLHRGNGKTYDIDKSGDILVVNQMRTLSNETVLIATSKGLFIFDPVKETIEEKRVSKEIEYRNVNITDAFLTENKRWIITTRGDGLYIVDNDGNVRNYREDIFQKNALLIDELNTLYRDNSGNIWMGSQKGVTTFHPDESGILGFGPSGDATKGIPSPNVWSFAESPTGRYTFIGTDRAISRWDRKTGLFEQYYRDKEHTSVVTGEMDVLGLHVISKDHLIVACADGIFELFIHNNSFKFEQVHTSDDVSSVTHNKAYNIVPWKGTACFIATKDGVVLYDYATKKVETFVHDPKNPKATITPGVCRVAYKDHSGRIWFATSGGGLNVLDQKNGEVRIIPYNQNALIRDLTPNYITSMLQEKEGIYWFSTLGSGLIRWNEKAKKGKVFNRKDGLPNDVIYGVLMGSEGHLWLSTNKGLCSFAPSTGEVKVFTEQDGLMSNEFNLGAFMKSKDGFLYFGGIDGYNYFHPKHLFRTQKELSVRFTKFKLENEWLTPNKNKTPLTAPIFETEELFLGYRQNSFTLRFKPSNISAGETINYKYHLKGSDEGEILLGSLNEIHFNALASGDYELLIYARRGNGPWSTNPARMSIHIASPFWRTWWFWTIIGLLAAIGIRLFIKRRIDAARREQIRLEIKVKNRTKEIQQQNQKIAAQKLKIEEERNKVLKQQKLLQVEKDKTEKLLKNVIPESTAEELKKRGKARARAYKTVSVLFTDFVGFTKISDRMKPTELVKKLDVYFTKFDEIIVKNNLEKIKTIGDAYMCAGGVPVRNNTNPIDTCLAALQIQHYMEQRKNDAIANRQEYWELRLGINTGEVTAGVIGSERLAYDVWGATVNQAQRMEMLGAPGKVTITGATYQYIEPYFECTFKGKAQTKSRGLIDMYEVDAIKAELSENGEGVFPNKRFSQIVNLHLYSSINYYKAERYIMRLLDKQLSSKLYYHSVGHSKDVVKAVERIALLENVTDEGLFLLKSAANYHDAGFIEQYDANEPIGARLAGEILPRFGYTPDDIRKIQELIFATKIPHKPKNQLEEILCDADLDYLGRDDFHEIADNLRRELKEHGKIQSDRQWDEIQVNFLKMHKYFTKTAIKTRRAKKLQHLKEVEERLKRNEYDD
jgi:class 3 adenylate cyclase/ligand-binding sensor domain-containing protein